MAKKNKKKKKSKANSDVLVVVESPSKAKTIEKYLGEGYEVMASKGHVVDLPKSGLGVDVEDGFKPEYQVMPGKEKTLDALKEALVGKKKLIIAVDPDREGEAIGWHVARELELTDFAGHKLNPKLELERIVFTEITKGAVQEALNNPRSLDRDLLHAQQTRRLLDRLVGYKLSPLIWKKIRYGLSAGRVQSVAVKLIVDREAERDKFKADEYWKLFSHLSKSDEKSGGKTAGKPELNIFEQGGEPPELPDLQKSEAKFELQKWNGKNVAIEVKKTAQDYLDNLESAIWEVKSVETREVKRNPKAPFTTSTLQQTAANLFGFSAKRTMTLAQKLYEQGLITYMRTDSTAMSQQAVAQAKKVIAADYGENYLPDSDRRYKTKSKVAQEAHEAIRPTDLAAVEPNGKGLDAGHIKLYDLIRQRALASQMVPAKVEQLAVVVEAKSGDTVAEFKATGQRLLFPGYIKVYPDKVSEIEMPEFIENERLNASQIFSTQHFTQPPARFTEASLIKELEKHGIGRPSTYAPIISTIQSRKYVEKENKYFIPTDNGKVVTRLLADHFPEIVDKDFTAEMEEGLDEIASGEKDWRKYLEHFYGPFEKLLAKKDKEISKDDYTVLGDAPKNIKCPECKSKMIIKLSKYGTFYSCSKFPDCKGMLNLDGTNEDDIAKKANTKEFKDTYKTAPKTDEGKPYVLKRGRYGEFWAHPDYPKVKDAQPLEYKKKALVSMFGEPPQTDDGRDFQFRTGRYGKFWAHPDYPKVKKTVRIKESKK